MLRVWSEIGIGIGNPNGIAKVWLDDTEVRMIEIVNEMEEEEEPIDLREQPPMSNLIRIGEIVTGLHEESKRGIVVGFDSHREVVPEAPSISYITNNCCVAYPFEDRVTPIHELLLTGHGLATTEQLLTFPHVEARGLALHHPELIGYTRT